MHTSHSPLTSSSHRTDNQPLNDRDPEIVKGSDTSATVRRTSRVIHSVNLGLTREELDSGVDYFQAQGALARESLT